MTNAVANYLRNKSPCEGNSLSYFEFDSETLKDSGLRKTLSPSTSPRVMSSISSTTPSLILVISGRIRTGLLFNFVNIQPEESYEKRGRNRRESENARVLRTFWKEVKRSLLSPTLTQLKTEKNAKFARKHLEEGIHQKNTSKNIPQVEKRDILSSKNAQIENAIEGGKA